MAWEVKTLNQLSENLDSIRVPITKKNRTHGSIPYYGASGIVDYVEEHIFDEDLLLISEDGANLLARTYPIAFSISGKTWVNNHAHVLRFKDKISQRFVELYLNSIKLDNFVSGMAQPKLNQKMLNKIPIPFPLISEQKRIVAILNEAFESIARAKESAEKNLKNANEIFESYLQSVFENKGEGWDEKKLGEVCSLMTGGTPSKNKQEYFDGGGIRWLVSGDVNLGEIYDCDGRITEVGMKNSNAKYLPVNSVIIALNGQGKTRGTVAMLRTKATCNQSLVSIYPKDLKTILPEYIYYNLNIRYKEIRKITGDTGNDRRGLNMPLIRNIKIPYPKLIIEQQSVIAKFDTLSAETKKLEAIYTQKLADLEELKKSILAKAFNGELTEASA
ncbi:MAG TPA: restriction endonuclease subunit S [Ignavibacteriaceae bacterium]|nr:restriction endonuclease subunit S [Ignavibacteriaceae bacterium]